jgi:hypothetical protein
MTLIELDCLERLAEAMKQHINEFHTIPPPRHPIWRVFWACSHIDQIIFAETACGRGTSGVVRAAISTSDGHTTADGRTFFGRLLAVLKCWLSSLSMPSILPNGIHGRGGKS